MSGTGSRALLASYLRQAQLTQLSEIAPLNNGLSNQNFYVRGTHPSHEGEGQWVLRVNSWASSQICDRNAEVANWQVAAAAGLAPKMVYISPCNQFYVSQFYPQPQVDWSIFSAENAADFVRLEDQGIAAQQPKPQGQHALMLDCSAERLLLTLLNGLSKLPEPDNKMSVDKQWRTYLQRLQAMQVKIVNGASHVHDAVICHTQRVANNVSIQKRQLSLLKSWQQVYEQLNAKSVQVEHMLQRLSSCLIRQQYSHRDLNPFNILLVDNKLNCIDFEYACSSHPLCDLAAVLASHSLSKIQCQWLIQQYLTSNVNLNHLALHCVDAAVDLYWVFAVCWALQMVFDHLVNEQGVNINTDKLNSAEEYLACAQRYLTLISQA